MFSCSPVVLLINFIPRIWERDAVFLRRYVEFSIKGIPKEYLSCQIGILKSMGLDIAAEQALPQCPNCVISKGQAAHPSLATSP